MAKLKNAQSHDLESLMAIIKRQGEEIARLSSKPVVAVVEAKPIWPTAEAERVETVLNKPANDKKAREGLLADLPAAELSSKFYTAAKWGFAILPTMTLAEYNAVRESRNKNNANKTCFRASAYVTEALKRGDKPWGIVVTADMNKQAALRMYPKAPTTAPTVTPTVDAEMLKLMMAKMAEMSATIARLQAKA